MNQESRPGQGGRPNQGSWTPFSDDGELILLRETAVPIKIEPIKSEVAFSAHEPDTPSKLGAYSRYLSTAGGFQQCSRPKVLAEPYTIAFSEVASSGGGMSMLPHEARM